MLLALGDRGQNATFTVDHVEGMPGTGSSSVLAPYSLPASHMATPRLRQYCRFTTTATVTDGAQGEMRLNVSLPTAGGATRLIAVLGHNLVESDQFDFEAFSDTAFTVTSISRRTFDCTRTSRYYLQTPGSAELGLPRLNGYHVMALGPGVGSLRFYYRNGLFRSEAFSIGRIWVSNAWIVSEQASRDWQIEFLDQGKTDLARNGGMYFSDAQSLRRFTLKFPAMDKNTAIGAGLGFGQSFGGALTCYNDVVAWANGGSEVIALLREQEIPRYRERMGVYGLLSPNASLAQVALAQPGVEFYSGQLQITERF